MNLVFRVLLVPLVRRVNQVMMGFQVLLVQRVNKVFQVEDFQDFQVQRETKVRKAMWVSQDPQEVRGSQA